MINIIHTEKLITVCANCKSGLEYELSDVQQRKERLYQGFFAPVRYKIHKHIECPKCGCAVKLFLN